MSATYRYVAVSPDGRRLSGKMRAPSAGAVASVLEADGFQPGPIQAVAGNRVAQIVEQVRQARNEDGPKVKTVDLATTTKQFAVLLRAGLPPAQTIDESVDACPSRRLAGVLIEIGQRIRQGDRLSEAFGAYPRTFGESYTAYVSAGEEAGELAETFEALHRQLSQQAQVEAEIRSATTYPKWAGLASLGIAGFMLVRIVPQFEAMYAGFGAELPALTQMLVSVKDNFLLVMAGLALIAGGLAALSHHTRDDVRVGTLIDQARFRAPVFGSLLRSQALYRWCATLAGMRRADVHMPEALSVAARASGSRWMQVITPQVVERISDGEDLARAISDQPVFNRMIVALVATGETTGQLPETLDSAAGAIAQHVGATIGALGKKIEVITLLVVIGVFGVIMAGLWLPILMISAVASESF